MNNRSPNLRADSLFIEILKTNQLSLQRSIQAAETPAERTTTTTTAAVTAPHPVVPLAQDTAAMLSGWGFL